MRKHNPKRTAQKLQKVIDAWTTLRPTKSFGGMTLEQFKAKVQPSLDARDQLTTLRTQAVNSLVQRHQTDDTSLTATSQVVNSVKGDPEEGEDGPLYAAMGYVPKSMKASGLTRKGQTTPVVPTAPNPTSPTDKAAK
jgi:hypothetical protein